ncbi:MAG: ATP-binding protein [Prevotellaceae bacterium]|jgi:AAA15 family ATPase/GTPase|nr:ATP-binding protein [Prevotellaceae bacterium]
MIINFSVQNFGSIKDKQTLSFEADKSTHLEDYYVINENGLRLLKLGLIYGANASGKTTILKALDFLRDIVLKPKDKKTEAFDFKPFLFDTNTPNQNTFFSIEFFQRKIRYLYEVELNEKAIVKEELYFYNPNRANVFKRTTDLDKQFSAITFGSKIKVDKVFEKTLVSYTLWNNTVLGGFLKTNMESEELKDVTDWFSLYLNPLISPKLKLDNYITSLIGESKIKKSTIIQVLNKADFNISDILIREVEEDLSDEFVKFLENQAKISKDELSELKKKGKVTSLDLSFEHTIYNVKYSLPLDEESAGTQRYYGLAGVLYMLIKQSMAFPIDELEASLHPDLFIHFLLSFLVNSKNSQIIATTHNREFFQDKDIFRKDAIWITDKPENGATELYSIADFDTSVIRDTSNIYNAFNVGKLGGIPNLGDYYIDMDYDEAK